MKDYTRYIQLVDNGHWVIKLKGSEYHCFSEAKALCTARTLQLEPTVGQVKAVSIAKGELGISHFLDDDTPVYHHC